MGIVLFGDCVPFGHKVSRPTQCPYSTSDLLHLFPTTLPVFFIGKVCATVRGIICTVSVLSVSLLFFLKILSRVILHSVVRECFGKRYAGREAL